VKTWIYSWLVYPLLFTIAKLWGLANKKVRETLRLRTWKDFLSLRLNAGEPIEYWIHVASYGELEYAIPILKELAHRKKRVLVTYYSISAKGPVEQLQKSYPNVSLVVPLPHDGLGMMEEFVALVREQGVRRLLLMKYELWPGLLWECGVRGIKVVLVDALKPGWFHRRLLHKLDGILSGYDSEIESISHRKASVVGDTRVERVLERVGNAKAKVENSVPARLRQVLGEKPVLVCGSMWPPDTKLIVGALTALSEGDSAKHRWNVVWVPHELDEQEAIKARAMFEALGYQVRSVDDEDVLPGKPLAVIVMKKGLLAELYHLGQAAFVGGGFGDGVHSVWEPALAGALVACGPRTNRSPESEELFRRKRLVRVKDAALAAQWLREKANIVANSSSAGGDVLQELRGRHVGAAQRIIDICEGNL
jgi:3-deoxy-D-manno-octulosonic-acid transferase